MANRLIEEVRQARSVADGLAVIVRRQKAELEGARVQLEEAQAEIASVEQAIAELDELQAEGEAALLEGTEFSPSGNA